MLGRKGKKIVFKMLHSRIRKMYIIIHLYTIIHIFICSLCSKFLIDNGILFHISGPE